MTDFEIRTAKHGDSWHLEGIASKVEVPYRVTDQHGRYEETIARGAFTGTLSRNPTVRLLIEHNPIGPILARTGRNMTLTETEEGHLHFRARLYKDDPEAAAAVSKVRHGLLDAMSFSFKVDGGDSGQVWSENYTRRRVLRADIGGADVSLCVEGANPHTHVSLRAAGPLSANSIELAQAIGYEIRGTSAVDLAIHSGAGTSTSSGRGAGHVAVNERATRARAIALEQEVELMRLKHGSDVRRRGVSERDRHELEWRARQQASATGRSEGDVLRLLTSRSYAEQELGLAALRRRG